MDAPTKDAQPVITGPYVGKVRIVATMKPIPIRIARCIPSTISNEECYQLAVVACRNACIAMDVVRHRLDAKMLERYLKPELIRRLLTFSNLLHQSRPKKGFVRDELRHMPVVPQHIHGLLVGPETYEVSVCFSIGDSHYWANIVLQVERGRWRCSLLDIG
ncbi:Rv3235 family protein [Bifidobacterium aquikefiricola]|uniref:Rv3235 family protein n=1 Tax=Bifidobacterium aquikefiricola TaxID=3059038 RepID=A0AB39U4G1_9BIFI